MPNTVYVEDFKISMWRVHFVPQQARVLASQYTRMTGGGGNDFLSSGHAGRDRHNWRPIDGGFRVRMTHLWSGYRPNWVWG